MASSTPPIPPPTSDSKQLGTSNLIMANPCDPLEDGAKNRLDFLWKIHGYTNDYIRFADTKAGFAAGAVLAVMGALVASHPFDALSGIPFTRLHYRVWFSAFALTMLVFSFVCALLAIRPRLKSTVPKGFIFWASVIEHESDMAYAGGCKKLSIDDMELNVSRHIYALATISTRKYFWTNLSIITGSLGGLLGGSIILVIHIFQSQ
jgi:hypothetical protein